ncbi:MAG TPA: hypothetical protein VG897_03005 [Terriglobales bacterium]|nr:hypothetical protein [Terriglobales bacterium]
MENPKQHLQDMAAVHSFYSALLKDKLGHEVPVPQEVSAAAAQTEDINESVQTLGPWLSLLDLAVAPEMVRDGLRENTTKETAESLLRYCIRKHSVDDADRDKADFIITFLFRSLGMPLHSAEEWSVDQASRFEKEIYTILSLKEALPLPEEHRQLIHEFPFIRQEAEDIVHFDALMDSGLMQRVRDIKQRFGPSFYHPRVLATIAEYNVLIGDRFDELFREAARSIKKFAVSVQEAGGSIMARVDGDVTVKQLSEVQGEQILEEEYYRAQEHLRKVSKFKKAVDTRRTHVPPPRGVTATSAAADRLGEPPRRGMTIPALAGNDVHINLDRMAEEGKLKTTMESIRNFILAADSKSANVYPMRHGNLVLSQPEIDAFRTDYRGEKSFRGEYATALARAVAIGARMLNEMEEFRSRLSSAYLWKPHADALTYLLQEGNSLQEECGSIIQVAEVRGLKEKVEGMKATLQRMRERSLAVAKALENTK